MKTLSEIQAILADEIEKIDLAKEPQGVYAPIKYILSLGGKRIRPALALLACNLFSEDIVPAINPALGIEIFHNFTLLHDDIMDKADVRRGKPTVHKKWDENTAILSGDVMQIIAYQYTCNVPEKELKRVLDAFSQMATEICEGQQYDMDFEKRQDVKPEEYLNMIRLKTAVLLGTALKIGAWLGGGNDTDAQLLYDFGINIGLAFQLKDDWLDVYGNEETFGKKIGGDILCNKKTYMLIQATLLAQGEDAKELSTWLESNDSPKEKIDAVTAIYNRLGVKKVCEEKMEYFYERAIKCLEQVNTPEAKKQELRNLAKKLMSRNE
ncbi:polyprenyl synthetase family protein [Paludibacter sp. 221]|uniref:polyprenyl synthetase family protein n=1 Tax=Paludibacter sp. 221 TaxID=2302939 RepID=UPI0013D1155F|nr:polyprenyl synthetase family protein [Paludibacter sp. 221]NDV46211.1 polyprenyl synthetase family protein [Paludibacter sp. 221]